MRRAALLASAAVVTPAVWTATASGLFLYGTGLWGAPSLPWWDYPRAWWLYAPYAGHSFAVGVGLFASALFAAAPLAALGRWQWRRWGGVAGMARRGLGIDRIRRGTTHNHGDARWMTMDEARELFPSEPHPDYGGILVGEAVRMDLSPVAHLRFDPRNPEGVHTWGEGGKAPLLIDHLRFGSGHNVTIAGSGLFKSSQIAAALLIWMRSAVVLDPACELAAQTKEAIEATGRRVVCLGMGDMGPNAMASIRPGDPMAETRLHALIGRITGPKPEGSSGGDNSAAFKAFGEMILTAFAAHLVWDDEIAPEMKTLRTLRAGFAAPYDVVMDRLRGIHGTSPSPLARSIAGPLVGAPDVTMGGALFNLAKDTEWLASDDYADLLSGDAFDPRDLANGKLVVFVQIPMEALERKPGVARVLIGSMIEAVFSAQGRVNGYVPFWIDEAVLMGNDPILWTTLNQGRKYRVILNMYYQSEGQIEKVWGEAGKKTWYDSVSWRTYGRIKNAATAKAVSEELGTFGAIATSKGENKGRSGRLFDMPTSSTGGNFNEHEIKVPLESQANLLTKWRTDERLTLVGELPLRHRAAIGFQREEMAALLRPSSFTAAWDEAPP